MRISPLIDAHQLLNSCALVLRLVRMRFRAHQKVYKTQNAAGAALCTMNNTFSLEAVTKGHFKLRSCFGGFAI